jgi:hypothetical protein
VNHYGAIAQRHWTRFLPSRTAALPNPQAFFTLLGQEVAQQVSDLAESLAGPAPAEETYLERVGRLEAARRQAQEKILTELVYLTAEAGSPEDEDSQHRTEPPESPSTASSGWIPILEDPSNPWWSQQT